MDWNRAALLAAQCVVMAVLGGCVIAGHDSAITDGLLAVSASIVGTGAYQTVKASRAKATTTPND